MLLSELNESGKPYRNRVEVFALKDGKVYGGFYESGDFGVFGGGTDGEDLESAAAREFEEESGFKIKNLKKLDVDPIEVEWEGEAKSDKQKERKEKYRGTRTWYYCGELDDDGKKDKATGDDGHSGLNNIGLKDVDDMIDNVKSIDADDDGLIKQNKARLEALKLIKNL